MNLPSRPLHLKLQVLGGKLITQDTREYSLTLKDMHGTRRSVRAVGIQCITEVKRAPNVKHLKGRFPEAKADTEKKFQAVWQVIYSVGH